MNAPASTGPVEHPAVPSAPPVRYLTAWRAHPRTILLIAAINTAIALVYWQDDTRPFWHPLLTVQLYGFAIAYCVNAVQPWHRRQGLPWLCGAVVAGALIGVVLVIVVKGYPLSHVRATLHTFVSNMAAACATGLLIGLLFYTRRRERRVRAELHRAESERLRLARQTVEAQLKLMQAQVEPHFLFNTLASVQFLIETDAKAAHRMLGHLIDYLRAALPQLRSSSSTLGKEVELARNYLSILAMRIGDRLSFDADVPEELAPHAFPPNLLISLVENAIKHGIEPSADGGRVSIEARRDGAVLRVSVTDTGRGLAHEGNGGSGVGLANVRERVAALYGSSGRFAIESAAPRGTRATIEIPASTPAA